MAGAQEAAGDRRKQLFAAYVIPELDTLMRVALSITGNVADAEDLVQDTLLRAFGAIDSFDGEHPRAWLFTILRNAQVNRTRRRRPSPLRNVDPNASLAFYSPSASQTSPEEVALGAAFEEVVLSSVKALPERYRCLVELIDIGGLSYAEAAGVLAIPVGTVMSRLHRARSRIRQRLSSAGLAPTTRE